MAYEINKLETWNLLNMQIHSVEATVAQSQSRYPILLNMQSHNREATVTSRRRGIAASIPLSLSRLKKLCDRIPRYIYL